MSSRYRVKTGLFCFLILLLSVSSACASNPAESNAFTPSPYSVTPSLSSTLPATPGVVPVYTYRIVHVYPHDRAAFTEGLLYDGGFLYESTGLNGKSSLRKVDLETGKVLQMYQLPDRYFGEGLAVYQNTLIQLTWQSHTGFVYSLDTFNQLKTFTYPTEGWGITYDGKYLVMSDGTSDLHFLDPGTEQIVGSLKVTDDSPVTNINELEYVKGKIYANIWKTNKIAIIDLQSGKVTGWIDLTGLLQTQDYSGQVDVLNGIAYDSQNDRLFVTGKLWPYLFEIKLIEAKG